MGDPGRSDFTNGTPAVLRDPGYRVRVVWSVPAGDTTAQPLFPVLLVERQPVAGDPLCGGLERHLAGPRASVTFRNSGVRVFAGQLGIALPRAATVAAVTLDGRTAEIARETAWGSMRYL